MSNGGLRESNFVSSAKACQVLGVCAETLRRWSREGKIRYAQNGSGGYRRYDVSSVVQCIGSDEPVDIIYARVSTRAQQKYLANQTERLVAKYGKHCTIITDVGSGLNFKRPGLKKVLEKVMCGAVQKLYVSHKDRLCRFAFDLVEFMCTRHGTEIIVAENGDEQTPAAELADDVLSIITVFGARLYGSRGSRGKQKRAHDTQDSIEGTIEELQDTDVSNDKPEEGIENVVCCSSTGIQ